MPYVCQFCKFKNNVDGKCETCYEVDNGEGSNWQTSAPTMGCNNCFYKRYGDLLPCQTCKVINPILGRDNNWLEDLTPKETSSSVQEVAPTHGKLNVGPGDWIFGNLSDVIRTDITIEQDIDPSILSYIEENTSPSKQEAEVSPSGDRSKSEAMRFRDETCEALRFKDESQEALRFNEGKTPYAHLPLDLLDGASRVMEAGSRKYSRGNYRKGYEDLYSPLNSVIRHLVSVQQSISSEDKLGEMGLLLDKETGEAHIHHLITSAMILIHAMRVKGYKV